MSKPTRLIAYMAVAGLFIGPAHAQQVDREVQRESEVSVEQNREVAITQFQEARRQLERAARDVAATSVVPVQFESLDSYLNLAEQYRDATGDALGWRWTLRSRARLGMVIMDVEGGALVTQVADGGAAAEAGIKVGDVIESIDGIALAGQDESPYARLIDHLDSIEPGDAVSLVVERGGDSLSIDVESGGADLFAYSGLHPERVLNDVFVRNVEPRVFTQLENLDRLEVLSSPWANVARTFSLASQPWSDMELVTLTAELGRYFDAEEGLLVVRGPSDESLDIRDGDVIVSISGRTPSSPEHAMRILGSFEAGETIEIALMRDRRRASVEYLMPESESGFNYNWIFPGVPASAPRPASPPPGSDVPAEPAFPID